MLQHSGPAGIGKSTWLRAALFAAFRSIRPIAMFSSLNQSHGYVVIDPNSDHRIKVVVMEPDEANDSTSSYLQWMKSSIEAVLKTFPTALIVVDPAELADKSPDVFKEFHKMYNDILSNAGSCSIVAAHSTPMLKQNSRYAPDMQKHRQYFFLPDSVLP